MKPFYAFAKALATFMLRLGGVRVLGAADIPKDEAMLVICNHISYGDPPAMAMVYPGQLTFIAKEAFGKNIFTRWLFGALGAVFLDKQANDLAALRAALNELKAGRSVAVFPEGRRNLDQRLGEFLPGAAYIALKSGARVLPLAVANTGDFWRIWKRHIVVAVGEPFSLDVGKTDKAALALATGELWERVAALLAEAQAVAGQKRRLRP